MVCVVAGREVDVWLATAESGRAATTQACRALSRHYGLSRTVFEIVAHNHVDEDPDLCVSVSHTRNLGAVAARRHADTLGVGVDVELAGRTLRAGAERHFLNSEDAPQWQDSLLRAWVAKEAAFKAVDPHRVRWRPEQDLLLSSLWLRDGRFGLYGDPQARGHYTLRLLRFAGKEVLVGVAILDAGNEA